MFLERCGELIVQVSLVVCMAQVNAPFPCDSSAAASWQPWVLLGHPHGLPLGLVINIFMAAAGAADDDGAAGVPPGLAHTGGG